MPNGKKIFRKKVENLFPWVFRAGLVCGIGGERYKKAENLEIRHVQVGKQKGGLFFWDRDQLGL